MKMRHRRRELVSPEVNVIPLIDVSLMLLIVFMVTAPMLSHGIKVTLPEGNVDETKGHSQEVVVMVDKDGSLFCNGSAVTMEQLAPVIKKKLPLPERNTVFVKADRQASYGHVIKIVDHLKAVEGVSYVALATTRAS